MKTLICLLLSAVVLEAHAELVDLDVAITVRKGSVITVQHANTVKVLTICNNPGKYMTGQLIDLQSHADFAIVNQQPRVDNARITFDTDDRCVSQIIPVLSLDSLREK